MVLPSENEINYPMIVCIWLVLIIMFMNWILKQHVKQKCKRQFDSDFTIWVQIYIRGVIWGFGTATACITSGVVPPHAIPSIMYALAVSEVTDNLPNSISFHAEPQLWPDTLLLHPWIKLLKFCMSYRHVPRRTIAVQCRHSVYVFPNHDRLWFNVYILYSSPILVI